MLEEEAPGAPLGAARRSNTAELASQGSSYSAQAGEAGCGGPHCWLQNQTVLAATWGSGGYTQSCWLHGHAVPAGATAAGWTPGRPPLSPHNSVLNSRLVQTHQMAAIKSPPEAWLQGRLGMVLFSVPVSQDGKVHREDAGVDVE